MSADIGKQIDALKQSIAALETQRNTLGDTVVKAALVPLQEKLTELESQQQIELRGVEIAQQRKQVTVLFLDIAGSTQLVNAMDPEDVMEVFDNALKRLGRIVESQGGHVSRYQGDGLMAVFGVPVAREDDPQRAVRAGLGLVDEANRIGEEMNMEGIAVRVGVNTGLVAVGGQTEAEDTLMGSAVNLAARLESAAPVGGVLISHETYRHVSGFFEIIESGPVVAKGFVEPVRAYHVLRNRARAFRQPMRGVEGLETRMVGREAELKELQDALMNVFETGEGQVITICGEAGVGKSRLLEEFQNWFELKPDYVWLYQGRGRAEGQGQPYGLLRDVFSDRFGILEDDCPESVREKFANGIQQGLDEGGEMKAHLLGQMLGYDFKDSPHLKGMLREGEQLHNSGMMYLGEYFEELGHQQAVVMLLEDIHWADDSTLDAINWLEERMHKLRMLVVCAAREDLYERRPYWGEGEERHTRIGLKPLTRRESRELVKQIFRRVTLLPDQLCELVVENSEGNPFYLEELIKMLIEEGVIVKGETKWRVVADRLHAIAVPSTLTGVLQARLDGLPANERLVLQEASVVGRQFWDRVVAYVHSGGKKEAAPEFLEESFLRLRGKELIFRREASSFAYSCEYLFKHDVLREVTYESVLKKVRKTHHSLVADWMIANAGTRISEYLGLIGEHLVLAGRELEAIKYLLQAGDAALAAYSSREAEGFYECVLELKPAETTNVAALLGLGKALSNQARREEAAQAFNQGIELARKLGDHDGQANLNYELAHTLFRWEYQDASKSWPICLMAMKELESAPASPGLTRLVSETGRQAYLAHQSRQVIEAYCNRALPMAEQFGLIDVELNNRITSGLANPDVDENIRIFDQAATQAEEKGLLWTAERAYNNLAVAEWKKLDYAASIKHHRKALDLARTAGLISDTLILVKQLVFSYGDRGQLQAIPGLVADALKGIIIPEQRASEFQLEMDCLLHGYKGEWVEALEMSRPRLVEAYRRQDLPVIMDMNGTIVWASLEIVKIVGQGDLAEADAAMRENMEILEENPFLGERIYSLFLLAQVETFQGHLKQAKQLLIEAERLVNQKDEMQKSNFDETRFYVDCAENHWNEAIAIVQSYLPHFREINALWILGRSLIKLGDTYRGRAQPGDQEQSRQAYQEALELFSNMGANGYVEVLQKRLTRLPAEEL